MASLIPAGEPQAERWDFTPPWIPAQSTYIYYKFLSYCHTLSCCPGLKPFLRLKENTTWRSSQECRLPVPWQGKLVLLSHIQVFHVTHFNEKLNFPCSDTFIAADPQLLQNRANLLKVKRHFWQHAVTPSSANGSVSENSSCVAGNYYCSH